MERFRSRAPWVALLVPVIPLLSGLSVLLRACPTGGLECLGRFVTGAFLVAVAAPTAIITVPLAAQLSTATPWTVVAIVLAVLSSGPLWWLAARRVARGLGEDEQHPWNAFLLRWIGACGVWFAFAIAVTLVSARLLV